MKNSANGTSSTRVINGKRLAAAEICLIIEASSKHSVSVLQFGDLYIRFGPQAPSQETVPCNAPSTPGVEIPDHDQINRETLQDDSEILREFQLEELKITDPLAYERLVRNEGLEELSDADDEPGDE